MTDHASVEAGGNSASDSQTDFGITVGGGYRTGDLDIRVALHVLDLGNAGDSMALVAGVGYNFWRQ
ncbi:MAG: hypothetical protein ABJA82_17450 [Myxococcales bacterium]